MDPRFERARKEFNDDREAIRGMTPGERRATIAVALLSVAVAAIAALLLWAAF